MSSSTFFMVGQEPILEEVDVHLLPKAKTGHGHQRIGW